MQFRHVLLDGPGHAIQMNALVRAVPARNVAQIAANAGLLIDARATIL